MKPDAPVPEETIAQWLRLPDLIAEESDARRYTQPAATHHRAILEFSAEERATAGDPDHPFEATFEGETVTSAD